MKLFTGATFLVAIASFPAFAQKLRGTSEDAEFLSSMKNNDLQEQGRRGLWFWDCPDGNTGDGCSAFCPCKGSNTCEAWHHKCRAPGKEGDPCHATRPCGDGFSCEAGSHKCRGPGEEGEPCHLTRPCGSGLTCEAGTHVCRAPGGFGDPCHLTRPCGSGFYCTDAITAWDTQICLPNCDKLSSAINKKLKSDKPYSDGSKGFDAKWEGGVVPYQISCDMNNLEVAKFVRAVQEIEDRTDVRFVKYNSRKHENWIILSNAEQNGFNSYVGRQVEPGWQRVNFDADYWGFSVAAGATAGTFIHELVHALGWPHTQSRPDRDEYVTIVEGNIKSENKHNFDPEPESKVYNSVQACRPYNYGSIMHYPSTAFANDALQTRTTIKTDKEIGKADNLNAQDIEEIQEYYFGTPKCLGGRTSPSVEYIGFKCAVASNAPEMFFEVWNYYGDDLLNVTNSRDVGSGKSYFTSYETRKSSSGERGYQGLNFAAYYGTKANKGSRIVYSNKVYHNPDRRFGQCIRDDNGAVLAACWVAKASDPSSDILTRMGSPSRSSLCLVPGH